MRIVIADDAVLFREGVAHLLMEYGLEVVDQVGNANALLTSVRDRRPDVALVDIRMPPSHTDEGLHAAREIRSRYPETAVLVLSQNLEPAYALRLVEEKPEGVGYLMKERVGRVQQLLDAVQRVAAGECVIDRAVVDELLIRRRRVDPIADLTPREREILALIAEGRSNKGICRTLWLSPKTVETHIRGAFAKLGINQAPEDNRRVLAVLTYLGQRGNPDRGRGNTCVER
jgi:DNA-binding NarL/FixJ family response regulator